LVTQDADSPAGRPDIAADGWRIPRAEAEMHGVVLMALLVMQQADTAAGPAAAAAVPVITLAAGFQFYAPQLPGRALPAAAPDTGRKQAVEHSDFYYKRLAVHRYASYATVPLFVTEYFLGEHLFNHPGEGGSTKSAHGVVAGGIAVLFGVNTITGVWNLWDSRHEPDGRTRRYVHSILMLAADAGFAWAGATAPGDEGPGAELDSRRRKHRTIALSSMGISLASSGMMLIWKD
jgi:hypothetical protein